MSPCIELSLYGWRSGGASWEFDAILAGAAESSVPYGYFAS